MKLLMNTGGIAGTNAFVVADDVARVAVLFDAPDHTVAPLLSEVRNNGWDLIGLWLTHGHFDHIADHAEVTAQFPAAKILIHPLEQPKLENPSAQLRIFPVPLDIPPRKPDGLLSDGQVLEIGSLRAKVVLTPGHAPGHVMFYITGGPQPVLVGGDLIIGGSIGRTDLPDSVHGDLETSIRTVMKTFPPDALLLPGHGSPATLQSERETNPYVRQILAADPASGAESI